MKAYIITQNELNRLRERRHKDGKGIHDSERHDIDDMHRWFNYEVCSWIDDISK